LIEGEVGTGKEMIARTIHDHGSRKGKAFTKLSTGDYSDLAIQQELFGNDARDPIGETCLLKKSEGGTLLIEEISGLSLPLQSRLLRFLQQRDIDMSIIFSTSTSSRELVQRGSLRSELFYFLSPYAIRVPALRDRTDDFELLVAHFMQRLLQVSAASQNEGPPRVSHGAIDLLKAHDWPGNVAQLKSVLQSVLLESKGAVLATDTLHRSLNTGKPKLNNDDATPHKPTPNESKWNLTSFVSEQLEKGTDALYESVIQRLDQQLVIMVLQHTQGNQAQASRLLGMTRTSLRRKIASSNIRLSDFAATSSVIDSAIDLDSPLNREDIAHDPE